MLYFTWLLAKIVLYLPIGAKVFHSRIRANISKKIKIVQYRDCLSWHFKMFPFSVSMFVIASLLAFNIYLAQYGTMLSNKRNIVLHQFMKWRWGPASKFGIQHPLPLLQLVHNVQLFAPKSNLSVYSLNLIFTVQCFIFI